MKFKTHCILFAIAILGWLAFYIIGYPSNYYTEWSFTEKILLNLLSFFAILPFSILLILAFINGNYLKTALWAAFYASFPLAIIDYIVVGIVQNHGLAFLKTHWYVTTGYVYVWIIFPIVATAIENLKKQ